MQAIDTEQAASVEQEQAKQPNKKGAVELLKHAWVQAGKPCSFENVLSVFLPDRAEIEGEGGYSIAALVAGIHANVRAGFLRVA